MGLDYKALSMGEYLEALESHNAAHDKADGKGSGDSDKLDKVMKARATTAIPKGGNKRRPSR